MRVRLELAGSLAGPSGELALPETLALLDGIAETRTLRGTAERLGLSYRAAWDRLRAVERSLGREVVIKTKGHGTVLTTFGNTLREAFSATRSRLAEALQREERLLGETLDSLLQNRPRPLRIATSHDPLFARVLMERTDVEVAVTGSEAALRRLEAGEADLAGCHFGLLAVNGFVGSGFDARPLFRREQGLILRKGNPLGIACLADLVSTGGRFINRQRGSGTRAWLDRMLVEEGIKATDISGYGTEEFTHQAVAATVAAGGADAGLGARAAAEALGLDFVPLGLETFFLVGHAGSASPISDAIAREVAARIGELAGYLPP